MHFEELLKRHIFFKLRILYHIGQIHRSLCRELWANQRAALLPIPLSVDGTQVDGDLQLWSVPLQ